jgi:hypothetical protein
VEIKFEARCSCRWKEAKWNWITIMLNILFLFCVHVFISKLYCCYSLFILCFFIM